MDARSSTHPSRRVAALLLTLLLFLPGISTSAGESEPLPTTVIVVRHAEKSGSPPEDPDLSLQGHARVGRLKQLLKESEVTAVFATEFQRTQKTVETVAEHFGLQVQVVPAGDPAAVAKAAREYPGGVVVIAGHSNTVGAIIAALGGGEIGEISEEEYDHLFVVTAYEEGKASVLRLWY